jgi:predicted NBD/HSP70 family sugar kinase
MRRISPTAFRIAKRETFREINRQIALNLIRASQPISRAELARQMGVRRGAVSRLVDALLESGLVFEGAKGESSGGRKPMQLYIETRRRCALAVDIGASRTLMLATDLLGQPLTEVVELKTPDAPRVLIRELVKGIGRLLAEHREIGKCSGLGIAVSGMVDAGRLRYSPTLGWRDVDLLQPLRAATRLPVVVENSCKACVLAQVWAVRGDAPVEGPIAFVNVSDGAGVGIAIDGKLLRGAHNLAGEFGHVTLDAAGPRCSCGQKGCWEAFVSKRATIARYLGADLAWPGSARLKGVTIESVIARARAGENRALEALRETGRHLGRGFGVIANTVDPRRIYIGGEITAAWDLVLPNVRDALRRQALIREAAEVEILTVPLGEHPRLRGAAALVSTPAFAAPVVA